MSPRTVEIKVSATDIPAVREVIRAAELVVELHEQYGLDDERVGGAILSLEAELGELIA